MPHEKEFADAPDAMFDISAEEGHLIIWIGIEHIMVTVRTAPMCDQDVYFLPNVEEVILL